MTLRRTFTSKCHSLTILWTGYLTTQNTSDQPVEGPLQHDFKTRRNMPHTPHVAADIPQRARGVLEKNASPVAASQSMVSSAPRKQAPTFLVSLLCGLHRFACTRASNLGDVNESQAALCITDVGATRSGTASRAMGIGTTRPCTAPRLRGRGRRINAPVHRALIASHRRGALGQRPPAPRSPRTTSPERWAPTLRPNRQAETCQQSPHGHAGTKFVRLGHLEGYG